RAPARHFPGVRSISSGPPRRSFPANTPPRGGVLHRASLWRRPHLHRSPQPCIPPTVACGCRPGHSLQHIRDLVSRPTVRARCDRWAAALLLSNGLEDPDCIELQQPLTSPIYCCGYIQDWGHETGKEVLPRGAGGAIVKCCGSRVIRRPPSARLDLAPPA